MARLNKSMHSLLNDIVINELFSKQIFTVESFVKADSNFIVSHTRLTILEFVEVKNDFIRKYGAKVMTVFDLYKNIIKNATFIPTGIPKVDDELLDGGLFTGNIYELSGLPATGKTLFCLAVARNVAQNLNQYIYYLDTKFGFSGRKFKSMLDQSDKKNLVEVLNRTLIKNINNRYELINSLEEIRTRLQSRDMIVRVIIIDSLPAVLMMDNHKDFRENSFLSHTVNLMRLIAKEFHVAFLVINLITLWTPDKSQAEEETVLCGKFWANIPNYQMKIERTDEENVVKISLQVEDEDDVDKSAQKSVSCKITELGFE